MDSTFNHVVDNLRFPEIFVLVVCNVLLPWSASSQSLITVWQTDNPGNSNNSHITIPLIPNESGSEPITIFWGDGAQTDSAQAPFSHTYAQPGTYVVQISGSHHGMSFAPEIVAMDTLVDPLKLINIAQWGNAEWLTMNQAFYECRNLSITALDQPNLSLVTDMRGAFSQVKGFLNVGHWDVSSVEDMTLLFNNCSKFNSDIGDWDVGNVITMDYMFSGADSFNQDIGPWRVDSVTSMERMFWQAHAFNQDISEWCVSGLTNMTGIFAQASSFNQPIGSWDVSNVTQMGFAFDRCIKFDQDLSGWDVGQVQSFFYTFSGCKEFNSPVNDWDMSSASNLQGMFRGCIEFNQPVDRWDVCNVINMGQLFRGCTAFNQPLGSWDVSYVETMFDMFNGASSYNQPLSSWELNSLTSTSGMFAGALNFNQPLAGWDVSNVTFMSGMFMDAIVFNQNIESWDVQSVTWMNQMFKGAVKFNQPLDHWTVDSVLRMEGMFEGASAFNKVLDSWNVSNVTEMQSMFKDAQNFNQPIGSWDVSSVYDMSSMFEGASKFNQDISQWNTQSLGTGDYFDKSIESMFKNAVSFNQPIGSWNTHNLTTLDSMFYGASNFDQDIGGWDIDSVETMEGTFTNSGLTTSSYDAILNGWGSQPVQEFVSLNVGNVTYCEGGLARLNLDIVHNWNITDGGEDCSKLDFISVWITTEPGTSANSQITIPTRVGFTYDYDVDWGDGTTSTGVTGSITHTFAFGPGLYTVRITGQFPCIYFNNGGDKEKLLRVDQWGSIAWESFDDAFAGCANLGILADDTPDLTNVTDVSGMFRSCTDLGVSSYNMDKWYLGNVTNMDFMFLGATTFNEDIGPWYTGSVTSMSQMFQNATNFNQDIGSWNTSNVTSFRRMFLNAVSFNKDINSWDVSSATDMYGMFDGATDFNQQLSNWDVSNVTNMDFMFQDASSFDQNLGNWDVGNVESMLLIASASTPWSTENYDSTLIGWARLPALQPGVILWTSATYCLGERARDSLSIEDGWQILDNGPAGTCPCPGYSIFKDGAWDAGVPAANTTSLIDGDYDSGIHGTFDACNLIINPGATLTVRANDTINIMTSIQLKGDVIVEPTGKLNINGM